MSDMTTRHPDLDLDELEREARDADSLGYWPDMMRPRIWHVLAVIARLREAEAELLEWRDGKAQDRVVALERVREAAEKVINAKRYAAYLSPGDKAQPYLAGQIEEGLKELDVALAAVPK